MAETGDWRLEPGPAGQVGMRYAVCESKSEISTKELCVAGAVLGRAKRESTSRQDSTGLPSTRAGPPSRSGLTAPYHVLSFSRAKE